MLCIRQQKKLLNKLRILIKLINSQTKLDQQYCLNLYSETISYYTFPHSPLYMLAESDSYNRIISHQQLHQSHLIFKQLLSLQVTKSHLSNPITDQQILTQPHTSNPLHKVVTLDCLRTRSINFTQEQKKKLQSVLNYFVRIHHIEYKQGLNEIAALFVVWTRIGVPISECYKMFERFFIRFSLNFYYDKDFTGLEMFFRMISLVLRYHCPSLSRYLAVYDIEPQIYALSWLMTLFSSKLSMRMTYLLWEYLIAQNDKYLLFFIVVGIIVHKKNEIIMTKNSSIFKIVTDMIFKTQQQLEEVIKISLILRKNTPISLTLFFEEKQLFDRLDSYKQSAQLLQHITKLNVLVILPKQLYSSRSHNAKTCQKPTCPLCMHNRTISLNHEITQNQWLCKFLQISNDIKKIAKRIEFVIIDLRKEKTKLNSVSQVHQVDITRPFEQIETSFLNEYLEEMSSKHFTILLTGFTFEDTTFSDKEEFACAKKFLHVLNSYSFPSLGILEGGYTALSIYEQEYRVKEKFQDQSISLNNILNSTNKTKPYILQNVLLQGTHQMTMSLSLLFEIAQLKYKGQVKIFNGSQKLIILVTQYFFIVLQDKQGLIAFISYLQHNCSIVPYFYSSFNNISCKVLKILPIEKILKLKSVIYSESTLVVKYFSQVQEEKQRRKTIDIRLESQKVGPGELSIFLIDQFKQLLGVKYEDMMMGLSPVINKQKLQQKKDIKTTQEKEKKLVLMMKDGQEVKQICSTIQGSFKAIMKHKYITQKNQQQSA